LAVGMFQQIAVDSYLYYKETGDFNTWLRSSNYYIRVLYVNFYYIQSTLC